MTELEKARKDCGCWDEEMGCLEDYPDECPYCEECRKDAEGE